MKIFISTDMEGVQGLSSWSDMDGPSRAANYGLAQQEVQWVVEALLASPQGEKIKEICICDSHARGEGIPFGNFGDPRVYHIRGYPRMFYMLEGLDASYAMLMMLGYHARIGAERGMMDHSYSSSCIYRVRIDGEDTGEVGINARLAGYYRVPVALVSGDDILEKEVKEFFAPHAPEYVRTKEGLGRFAGKMYPKELLKEVFHAAALNAVDPSRRIAPTVPSAHTVLEIDFNTTVVTDAVSVIPGLTRTGGRSVEYRSDDFRDIYRMIHAAAMLGGKFAAFT